ncbi:hypothetical protein OS493_012358 [Desmophyllum pertusum]|uniref:Uncharacterized protein n=1 Tax=Desmophyllum pertusum TaxID=174260 RepID=A0A9X0D3Y6_9CNID|nr:hypothetical protein OS493_012358 [Desmophyllum pertusum]
MDSLVPYYSDSDSSPELCSEDHDQPPTKSARVEELITASSPPLVLSSSDGESDDPSLERRQTNSSADEGDSPDPSEIPPQLCETASSSSKSTVKAKAYAIKFTELPGEMRIFLKAVEKFFTRAVNLERQTPPLKNSTYSKAQERMLAFLGFLHANLRIQLTPEVFLRPSVLEKYLDYLQAVRKCSPATVANHASSLLYPVKFLHREHAPNYHNIPVIRQIRTQATILQREGDLQRPKSKEELAAANRWLEWEEIVQACSLQRDYFEMAVNGSEKVRECGNLVVLAMYVFIPPSRGLEIRTLQIERDWKNFTPEKSKGKNLVLLQESSQVTLHFDNYKTQKHYGHEQILLKGDTELCKILVEYVNKHRPKLLSENSGQTLLLVRST